MLKKAGKKVVLVNFSGSAMGLVPESSNCDAILQAWYPGEAGGTAVANVLLGNYNPAGRLPVTFYKNVNQLPNFTNYDMKGRTYRYMKEAPLFPFGFGLSYTTFKYSKIQLDKKTINAGQSVKLSLQVKNTGKVAGGEVVQVYLKKMNDTDGPEKTLRVFKRVLIQAGKTIELTFDLNAENLEWWDAATNTMHTYAGDYQLMVGGSSQNENLKTLNFIIQ